ncbi:MAG: ATP-binding cassette domain-containing protein [Bacteroidales bacterium]|jgi:ABC-2 type transport system ATP-binding protein|nr:ATP-binding cassette domain-containing protein [Bacteroidales bacterium]MDD2824197.1 ATP-binding cassette domain-containing protein [Bacteroidales bacterium]MDD3100185.1 ATP-binding cassette domain-containing protein [Bacteroidales bacterium]MDD3638836.1 ATP-binding cassette domain-containing protein [Bacteroidales bacterium]MDD3943137.1 ATP-binding cassette domain-containing protein [Bacteroidales bacterium]
MSILVTNNVVKSFEGHLALDQVSIDVPDGKIFGLLGPNGAGKTTLLRIVNQITAPDSGNVFFDGHPLTADDVFRIGYLPEERGLYKKMKIGDQAMYLARLKGMTTAEAQSSLKSWFVRFGIQAWWNKKITELSKGMAQKVQFVTTVMHNPKLLILDEPFSGFDPINVDLIRNEIIRLKEKGTSVILSTHNMESVEEMCDEIALIDNARLVVAGKVHDIRRIHGDNHIEILYRASLPLNVHELGSVPFSVISEGKKDGSYQMVVALEEGHGTNEILTSLLPRTNIIGMTEIIPRMHDIFIKLVTNKEERK